MSLDDLLDGPQQPRRAADVPQRGRPRRLDRTAIITGDLLVLSLGCALIGCGLHLVR